MWKFEKIFIHTCDMFLQTKSHIIGHMIYYNNPQLLKVHGCFFMDFITNLMCSKPYNSIFVVVDWFTKTSVNPVHNAPVAPPPPLLTSDRKQPLLLHGCCECSLELLARRHPKKKR